MKNKDKSIICFSKSCREIDLLCALANLKLGHFPFKYLGIPILDGFH